MLYKVLRGGRSFHGGSLAWSLPVQQPDGSWQAGDWMEIEGDLAICVSGLHLTREPARWWAEGAECYETEVDGDVVEEGMDKVIVRRCRLLRRLSGAAELATVQIFTEGSHTVTDGVAHASGSSQVEASGSSQVEASGSSLVEAYGSSRVHACDSSRVRAYDSSQVEAFGSSRVEAFGSSQVRAYGSSQVHACDSSRVRAYDSSRVEAYDSALVHSSSASGAPTVAVHGDAVWVERVSGVPVVHAVTAPEIVLHPEADGAGEEDDSDA